METSRLIQEIYMKYGEVTKEDVKKILVRDYHMLNESQLDTMAEGIASGIKSLAQNVGSAVKKLSKAIGNAVIKQVQKFGQLLLSFKNANWDGYADPNSGALITGLYSPSGNFKFTSDVMKNPVIFINDKTNPTQPIPEAFIQKLFNEIVLSEAVGVDDVEKEVNSQDLIARKDSALAKEVRRADVEANSRSPLTGWNNTEATIQQYGLQILPRFLTQVEARPTHDAPIPSILIVGPPGVAKTYYAKSLRSVGAFVAIWELSREQDFTIEGIPVVSETTKEDGTKEFVTNYARPKILPATSDKRNCVFFFDEFNRAQKKVLDAAMNFVQSGELKGYICPVHSGHIIAANAGDGVIDNEKVSDIANSLLERVSKTFVLRGNAKDTYLRGISVPKDDKEIDSILNKSAAKQLKTALDMEKSGERDISKIPEDVAKADWVTTLGAIPDAKEKDDFERYAFYKNPFDKKSYAFPMGVGGHGIQAPIVANWLKYRSSGKAGHYETSPLWKQAQQNGNDKIKTTGDRFQLPLPKFITGSEGTGDFEDMHLFGSNPREVEKLANEMKKDALYDFMTAWLYGASLPSKLQVKKPIKYFVDNWRDKGYASAPHFFFSVNQEYYLQYSINAVAIKDKKDQDYIVRDMLDFYKQERELGQFLDRNMALFAFSVFKPVQVKMISDVANDATDSDEGAIDIAKEERKQTAKERIDDVRIGFQKELPQLLNSFENYKDFATKAKRELEQRKRQMADFDEYIDYEKFKEEISGDEDNVLAFVANNIDAVLETLKFSVNGIIGMFSKEKLKTEFAQKVYETLKSSSELMGRARISDGHESQTLQKGNSADEFLASVMSIAGGGKPSSAPSGSEEAPPVKRGRGRPKKTPVENESLDDISKGFKKLFESLR